MRLIPTGVILLLLGAIGPLATILWLIHSFNGFQNSGGAPTPHLLLHSIGISIALALAGNTLFLAGLVMLIVGVCKRGKSPA